MTRITLDALEGGSLNVELAGDGPVAVMALHGFTGNAATWDSLSGAAGGEYRIISPDLTGHGESDGPENPRLYDMKHTVGALAEILDHLKITRVHWLGYSMGGRIALGAAIHLPERTVSLTLESASPGLSTVVERTARVTSDEELAGRIEAEGIAAFVDYWESLPLWASQARLPLEIRRKLREQRLANRPVGLANSLRGIGAGAQPPLHRRLKEISFPSLFIAGDEDAGFVAIAQQMQAAVPGSLLRIIPESGHAVHLEQPDCFNRAVLDFIGNADSPLNITGARSQQNQ